VQKLLSLQGEPFCLGGFEHRPVAGSHAPASWHWSNAGHWIGLAPTQTPDWHVSTFEHASPSLQATPFAFGGCEQPVIGLHKPGSWHWSSAWHVTGLAPEHAPAWHVSVCVQTSASSHGSPSTFAGLEQTPVAGSQTPWSWH
jgi:hypothetical protein